MKICYALVQFGLVLMFFVLPARAEMTGQAKSLSIPDNARTKYLSAVWAARLGDDDLAIRLFNQITNDYPDFARAYTNLGLLHLKRKDLAAAEQSLKQAVRLYPKDAIAYNHLGVVLRNLGKFREAEQAYTNSLEINNQYHDAVLNRAILYDLYLHDLEKALDNYKQYQAMQNLDDKTVSKWIVDLERRVKKEVNKKPELASVQE